jgi:hypothetical protein
MKVAELLARPEQWWRGGPLRFTGQTCLYLAVREALTGKPPDARGEECLPGEDITLLRDIIGLGGTYGLGRIFDWNDDPARTFAEVHAVAAEFDRRRALRVPESA